VQILPILCLCQQYSVCGCDDNTNSTFLTALLPNGTAAPALNASLARISDVNGTRTLVLNGTLPNGTTASFGTRLRPPRLALPWAVPLLLEQLGWGVLVALVSSAILLA
jgi:hypothetical protein